MKINQLPENMAELEGISVIEAVSCGGVVIHRGKVLLLYKNQNGRYMGWVMPKGTVEAGETYRETALREVKEETDSSARIVKYIGKTQYTFRGNTDVVNKTVHWYLMVTDSFSCKPQAEEYFADAGFYKQHEAYYLLKFHDEKQIMRRAFMEYNEYRSREFKKKYAK
jgi:ADP-ribose pyrophosphatase YjhB (NUDIX family)